MSTDLATTNGTGTVVTSQTMETVLVSGDLSGLSPEQRLSYYKAVCESLELNPLTKPFAYIKLNNALQLYALKGATDQIREKRHVQITHVDKEVLDDLYVVTAHARLPDGRTDSDIGAVNIAGLRGEAKANAMMKAITKAKRRVTLSICGLGMLDESEAESIPASQRQFVEVNHETGEIISETPRHASNNDAPMTPNQKRYIESLARDTGMDQAGLESTVEVRYGKPFSSLSKSEASAIIEAIQVIKDDQSLAGFDGFGEKTLDSELAKGDRPRATSGAPQTQAQMAKLFAEANERGWHEDQVRGRAAEINPAVAEDGLKALDRAEVSTLIEAVINESPWVDPRQQRFDVEPSNEVEKAEVSESTSTEPVDRDQLKQRLTESGDSKTLAAAWHDVTEAGMEMDTELFGIAYDLLKAIVATADDMAEWAQAMNDARKMGFGGDDELKTVAESRRNELRAA